jgi:hypothetical protein
MSGLGPMFNGEKHDSGFSARSVSNEESYKPQREEDSFAAQAAAHQTSSNAFAQRKINGGSRSVSMGSISHQLSSPVMNETLSVIEEHITDMNTPRQSYLNSKGYSSPDTDTDFISPPLNRLSYINGNETDEEDVHQFSESEVREWSPAQVAEHLETLGADRSHCQVFQEQEISGDLLLDMDRGTILLREFDLGTLGRRLGLFQKIQRFQNDIKGPLLPSKASSMSMTSNSESVRDRAVSGSANLPIVPALGDSPKSEYDTINPGRQRASTHGGLNLDTSGRGHVSRPSTSSIRSVPNNRRHSSIEMNSAPNTPKQTNGPGSPWHNKQRSVDTPWGVTPGVQSAGLLDSHTSAGLSSWLSPGLESPLPPIINSPEYRTLSANAVDLDRGYSSSNENDSRKFRNILRKRDSGSHSRTPSESNATKRLSGVFKHMRSSSSEVPGKQDSPTAGGREDSPTIKSLNGSSLFASSSPTVDKTSPLFSKRSTKQKVTGLRAISDAITSNEKSLVGKHTAVSTLSTDLQSPVSVDSSNQSITSTGKSVSFEEPNPKSESTSKLAALPLHPSASRRKAKRETSAYTKGLEKKSPAEQIAGADYSGWMKKKSKKLGKWHPRLFVLKGRRLSYYYSEDDTEEKGLIDISFHRVLPANKDLITGFHASLRAGSGPVSPEGASLQTAAQVDAAKSIKDGSENSGIFIFKLVPPRPGLSKAVNFTQPKVHFFAAASLQEGRNWMAALMKATIERDELKPISSTYKEKTMSLNRAKELRVRPPELAIEDSDSAAKAGLGITKIPEAESGSKDGDKDNVSDGWSLVNGSPPEATEEAVAT